MTIQKPTLEVTIATKRDEAELLSLIRAYHEFEKIVHDRSKVLEAIGPLLERSDAGRVWMIRLDGKIIGYIALCFGYSIEFHGRDGFVDEVYLLEEYRGQGIGKAALAIVKAEARELGVRALHLEVSRGNKRAQRLYTALGFESREEFFLMTQKI